MGILGLSKLIADICPEAIKEQEFKSYFGRRIAIDASMSIYQFLIAIRQTDALLTNEEGQTTSHLIGLFYRTCKLLEAGIKPVYVFDGKAPELKSGELEKRKERRELADQKLKEAKELEDIAAIHKFSKRLVRVTTKHVEDCKKLLELMGIPVICAPSEAEAQCAQLCKEGLVYGIASEDMDGLTFGTIRLIRHLSSGRAEKIKEYSFEKVLAGLELSKEQFIDLCILMGCDYCDRIKGIGGKKGLELIKKYGSIEEILRKRFGVEDFIECEVIYKEKDREIEINSKIDDKQGNIKNGNVNINTISSVHEEILDKNSKEKIDNNEDSSSSESESDSEDKKPKEQVKENSREKLPSNWLFKGARKLFVEPCVDKNKYTDADLKNKEIDEDGLIEFLCKQNGFNEDRVRAGIKRIRDSRGKCSQTRIDSFFKALPTTSKPKIEKPTKRTSSGKSTTSKRGRPR